MRKVIGFEFIKSDSPGVTIDVIYPLIEIGIGEIIRGEVIYPDQDRANRIVFDAMSSMAEYLKKVC